MVDFRFIKLDRKFFELDSDNYREEIDSIFGYHRNGDTDWVALEEEYRVVLLASAGSGKTTEMMHQIAELRSKGKRAFFVRLENLADRFDEAFCEKGLGTHDEFRDFISSGEEGWIYADSVDEARMGNPKDFQRGIRKLSKELGDCASRTHILISSRPYAWRGQMDVDLIRQEFDQPPTAPKARSSALDEADGLSPSDATIAEDYIAPTSGTEHNSFQVKLIGLRSLREDQAQELLTSWDLISPNECLERVKRNGLEHYIWHPQDLILLARYWETNRQIANRKDLLEFDILNRLLERDPDRQHLTSLTQELAETGAKRLALAVLFMKEQRLTFVDGGPSNLNPIHVLNDWTPAQVQALLALPIFDQAEYGSVRFHHRVIWEYMSAKWLLEQIGDISNRDKILGLCFRQKYGEEIITPTMRPLLPWLALENDLVRNELIVKAPEIFLEGGDPKSFSSEFRAEILKALCNRIATNHYPRFSVENTELQLFIDSDIEETVLQLLREYEDEEDVQFVLLRGILFADLKNCKHQVHQIAISETADKYSRLIAIRIIGKTDDTNLKKSLVDSMRPRLADLDKRILTEILSEEFSEAVTVAVLLEILACLKAPPDLGYSTLEGTLSDVISRLPDEALISLLDGLNRLMWKRPYDKKDALENVSSKHKWLIPLACQAVGRLIEKRDPSVLENRYLKILKRAYVHLKWSDQSKFNLPDLTDLVSKWAELNQELFWYSIGENRQRRKRKGQTLKSWHEGAGIGGYWEFASDDFEYFIREIQNRRLLDNKLVALSFAFRLYVESERKPARRRSLWRAVAHDDELKLRLHTYLHPPRQTAEEREQKQKIARLERRVSTAKKQEEERQLYWVDWLPKNIYYIRDSEILREGKMYGAQRHLLNEARIESQGSEKWSDVDWRVLATSYGEEVSTAFRDCAISCWRSITPKLRSEGIENPSSISSLTILGLAGIKFDEELDADWIKGLTIEDVDRAIRYALLEMNGFPDWFPVLFSKHKDTVIEVLSKEALWGLKHQTDPVSSYVLSDVVWHGDWLGGSFARRVFDMVEEHDVNAITQLECCLRILMRDTGISNHEIEKLCCKKLATLEFETDTIPFASYWLASLISVSPTVGIDQFVDILKTNSTASDNEELCMQVCLHLFGSRFQKSDLRTLHIEPKCLHRLYDIFHGYIKVEDDIDRSGSGAYSPTLRDNAQTARDGILQTIASLPGKETHFVLSEIASSQTHRFSQEWVRNLAHSRALQDADLSPWQLKDLDTFANLLEKSPSNHGELYQLSLSRLQAMKRWLEDGEQSLSDIWAKSEDETQLRKLVASWLTNESKSIYSIAEESELADKKRPDIRFFVDHVSAPIPVELKIYENWSGPDLLERMENQLCNDYLRDYKTRSGIFLIIRKDGKGRKRLPGRDGEFALSEFCDELQSISEEIVKGRTDIDDIDVVCIDLLKRQIAKR